MADDSGSSPETTPTDRPASGGTSPSGGPAPSGGSASPGQAGGRSPLDDLEEGPFGGDDPFGSGGPFGAEPPALTMAKFWIRQNALLSVGTAFAAGVFIGVLKR